MLVVVPLTYNLNQLCISFYKENNPLTLTILRVFATGTIKTFLTNAWLRGYVAGSMDERES